MRIFLTQVLLLVFVSCNSQTSSEFINPAGKTLKERIYAPHSFERINDTSTTYDEFLRSLPLKANGEKVYLYNGQLKNRQDVYSAVINYDIGKKDLQQCADAVMRIHAEYLYHSLQFSKIHFNFTNGVRAEFVNYAEGYRFNPKTNKWTKTAGVDYSFENFKKYLELVYTYAGSLSLSKELVPVKNIKDIKPGDVFIKGGSPGHAVTVIDVVKNKLTGHILFLIAQSYMPAQNIHVLKNFNDTMMSPWYNVNFGNELKTPEWTFTKDELMRFKD